VRQWTPREIGSPGGDVAGAILVVVDVQEQLLNVMNADADSFRELSKLLR